MAGQENIFQSFPSFTAPSTDMLSSYTVQQMGGMSQPGVVHQFPHGSTGSARVQLTPGVAHQTTKSMLNPGLVQNPAMIPSIIPSGAPPGIPRGVTSVASMLGAGLQPLSQPPVGLGQGSHDVWGNPLQSLMQTPRMHVSTVHSQFNIQSGISNNAALVNPYPQNPGLATITSPITTLTTANHSPRLVGDDQKALLNMYSNPNVSLPGPVTIVPDMEIKQLTHLPQPDNIPWKPADLPRVLKQIPLPDIITGGDRDTPLPQDTAVKMEMETTNMGHLVSSFLGTDSNEGMLGQVMGGQANLQPISLLQPAMEEPAPGKVYIDTALDPTLGHTIPALGTISYISSTDEFTSSDLIMTTPKRSRQTARKSLTPSPREAAEAIWRQRRREWPRGTKKKVGMKARGRLGGAKFRRPGPKSKDSANPVKSDPKLTRLYLSCNLVSFKAWAQLTMRDPIVKVKVVDEEAALQAPKATPKVDPIRKGAKRGPKKGPRKDPISVPKENDNGVEHYEEKTEPVVKQKKKRGRKKKTFRVEPTCKNVETVDIAEGDASKDERPKTDVSTAVVLTGEPAVPTGEPAVRTGEPAVPTGETTEEEFVGSSANEMPPKKVVRKKKRSLGLDLELDDLDIPTPRRSRMAVNYAELGGVSDGDEIFQVRIL